MEIAKLARYIGIETNNWAKLMSLVEGLELCKILGCKNVEIQGDYAIIGMEIANLARYIGIETNSWAKLIALVEELELCKTLGCKNVEIEGDYAIITNSIRK